MTDPFERNPITGAGYYGYAGRAPSGLYKGTNKNGVAALVLGICSLVLSATSALPFVAWIFVLTGISLGLTAWLLPGAATPQKLMSGVGVAAALFAAALMLG